MNDVDLPDAIVAAVAAGIEGLLGDDLVGVYLYGSAVSGDFVPGVSDVDLVAVTARPVESDGIDLAGLERMYQDVARHHPAWDDRIEVVHVARETLATFRTSSGRLAVISPGEPFHVRDDAPRAWLQNWYLVRETGVGLRGPDPRVMIPAVDWAEFLAATAAYAAEVRDRDRSMAGGGTIAYALLTMCRALCTFKLDAPCSKSDGARRARERDPGSAWLIDAAMACRATRGRSGFRDARSRAAAEVMIGEVADEVARLAAPAVHLDYHPRTRE